ncbi:MAG: hypothetical protein LLG93_01775 [Deltaproteobacteria bacterium]|nr:hypothetical protein [Deltaproteobacteria bacterium]
MAPGVLPKPGTKLGPCSTPCVHRDCEAVRTTASSICPGCKKPIGYDRAYYQVEADDTWVPPGTAGPWHAACLEDQYEKHRQAPTPAAETPIGEAIDVGGDEIEEGF